MSNTSKISAVAYSQRFLKYSWLWLQDEEVRYLTMSPRFTREQQITWFTGLQHRNDYLIWGIQFEEKPIGAFGIKNIDGFSGEYWGYIGNKKYWGVGIGKWMVNQAINSAKENGIKRLYLKVHQENYRAINLYVKSGFILIDSQDNIHWMECNV